MRVLQKLFRFCDKRDISLQNLNNFIPKDILNALDSAPSLASDDFVISPSLAEGDKGCGLKSQNNSPAKILNSKFTHPLAPSAREGEQINLTSAMEGEYNLDSENHALFCLTSRSEVSQKNRDSSVATQPQNDKIFTNFAESNIGGGGEFPFRNYFRMQNVLL
ncbi:hypothetical protein ACWIUD_06560 [Helicobacter sp. 23-1044]